jgi:hypothetical protein
MRDLRKAVEMALEAFEQIHESCGFVKEESEIHKDAKDLATEVRKDCNKYMEALRQALAQEEKPPVKSYCGGKPNYCTPEVTPEVIGEAFALDRGCWERGCIAHDERDGDGVTIEAKLKEKNT